MPRKSLSSPLNNVPPPPPSKLTTTAGDLECFQRARPFRAVVLTLFVFLFDVSGSMRGKSIESLRNGFRLFLDAVRKHPRASKAVEVALVAVCGDKPKLLAPFQSAAELAEPALEAAAAEEAKPPRVEVYGLAVNSNALGELEEVLTRRPVLVEKFGFEEIMKKLGQSVIEFRAGRSKDLLQPLQEPLPKPAAEETCEPAE